MLFLLSILFLRFAPDTLPRHLFTFLLLTISILYCVLMGQRVLISLSILLFLFNTVCYSAPLWIRDVKTTFPVTALTLDDGPHPYITPKILDLLKKENVKATFFLVATHVERYPDLVRRIVLEGHEIGNHSFNHDNFRELTVEEKRQDIIKSQEIFKNVIGYYPRFFRPPYGKVSRGDTVLLKKYFEEVIYWSVDSRDWEYPYNIDLVNKNVLSRMRPGHIILCHQRDEHRVDMLSYLIKHVKGFGYDFVTVTDLLRYNASSQALVSL